jgi:heme exporter protein C
MNNRIINWFKFTSPRTFYPLAGKMIPCFWLLTAVFGIAGLWVGLFVAPSDAMQGEGYRIIFVHVPASWMSMFIYVVMASWAGVGLALNARLSAMMAQALAPTGALMAFLSLCTGAFWGKPMWGTWWVWDARLTSELVLFFLYLGFIALQAAIDDPRRADKAGAILALVGVVNVPIIYFSVQWWNTLHQGASVSLTRSALMAQTMLWGMLLMALCFWMYSVAMALSRLRTIILEREAHTDWVHRLAEVAP